MTVFTTMCPKERQTSDNLIIKDYCFIIEIFDKFSFSGILRGCLSHLTLNMPGFLQTGMAGRGGGDSSHLCNFCLNGPIDLKFGMLIVLGKISRNREKHSNKK